MYVSILGNDCKYRTLYWDIQEKLRILKSICVTLAIIDIKVTIYCYKVSFNQLKQTQKCLNKKQNVLQGILITELIITLCQKKVENIKFKHNFSGFMFSCHCYFECS